MSEDGIIAGTPVPEDGEMMDGKAWMEVEREDALDPTMMRAVAGAPLAEQEELGFALAQATVRKDENEDMQDRGRQSNETVIISGISFSELRPTNETNVAFRPEGDAQAGMIEKENPADVGIENIDGLQLAEARGLNLYAGGSGESLRTLPPEYVMIPGQISRGPPAPPVSVDSPAPPPPPPPMLEYEQEQPSSRSDLPLGNVGTGLLTASIVMLVALVLVGMIMIGRKRSRSRERTQFSWDSDSHPNQIMNFMEDNTTRHVHTSGIGPSDGGQEPWSGLSGDGFFQTTLPSINSLDHQQPQHPDPESDLIAAVLAADSMAEPLHGQKSVELTACTLPDRQSSWDISDLPDLVNDDALLPPNTPPADTLARMGSGLCNRDSGNGFLVAPLDDLDEIGGSLGHMGPLNPPSEHWATTESVAQRCVVPISQLSGSSQRANNHSVFYHGAQERSERSQQQIEWHPVFHGNVPVNARTSRDTSPPYPPPLPNAIDSNAAITPISLTSVAELAETEPVWRFPQGPDGDARRTKTRADVMGSIDTSDTAGMSGGSNEFDEIGEETSYVRGVRQLHAENAPTVHEKKPLMPFTVSFELDCRENIGFTNVDPRAIEQALYVELHLVGTDAPYEPLPQIGIKSGADEAIVKISLNDADLAIDGAGREPRWIVKATFQKVLIGSYETGNHGQKQGIAFQPDRFRWLRLRLTVRALPACTGVLSAMFTTMRPRPDDPDQRDILFQGATNPFPVLSYRSYHDRKVALSDVNFDTELRRIKSVGAKRLKYLREAGVTNLRDLYRSAMAIRANGGINGSRRNNGDEAAKRALVIDKEFKRLKIYVEYALKHEKMDSCDMPPALTTQMAPQAPPRTEARNHNQDTMLPSRPVINIFTDADYTDAIDAEVAEELLKGIEEDLPSEREWNAFLTYGVVGANRVQSTNDRNQ